MKIRNLGDDISLERLSRREDFERFERRFVDAYRSIFAQAPYFESFSREEAETVFRTLRDTEGAIVLVLVRHEEMVAFAAAVPLAADAEVSSALSGLVPARHTMYLVELGVSAAYQGQGYGKLLVKERLNLVDHELYTHVVLRVAEGRSSSFEMYRALNFTDMGVSMMVSHKRTDGEVKEDRRFFMSRVLSQVKIS